MLAIRSEISYCRYVDNNTDLETLRTLLHAAVREYIMADQMVATFGDRYAKDLTSAYNELLALEDLAFSVGFTRHVWGSYENWLYTELTA